MIDKLVRPRISEAVRGVPDPRERRVPLSAKYWTGFALLRSDMEAGGCEGFSPDSVGPPEEAAIECLRRLGWPWRVSSRSSFITRLDHRSGSFGAI
jgi:hypothetical protein